MTWSYDETSLGTSTAAERKNAVRLLVGDTNTSDQQVQDEEITFALSQTGDNIYFAASWVAGVIASLYSRKVDTDIDGDLSAKYSDLAKQYRILSVDLRQKAQKYSGNSLGVYAGGISITEINAVRDNTDRPTPFARMDRFTNPEADGEYIGSYKDYEY